MAIAFSGAQPTGIIHLGNYFGAMQNWLSLQDQFQCFFSVVDLHALTTVRDEAKLRHNITELSKLFLAIGLDPKKSVLFRQSAVKEHAELAWILNCLTPMGELERMTQFKDKTRTINFEDSFKYFANKHFNDKNDYELILSTAQEIVEMPKQKIIKVINFYKSFIEDYRQNSIKRIKASTGLFSYPVLMAADILLYDTEVVPVGEDQVQHVELARVIARKFNKAYGNTFKEPKALLHKSNAAARLRGLDDPTKKMSKSASSEYNYLALTDKPEIIKKKIQKAVTDSGTTIKYETKRPAIANLMDIYSLVSGLAIKNIEDKFSGLGYGAFKADLIDQIIAFVKPIQEKLSAIDANELAAIYEQGAQTARKLAAAKMQEVKEKIGL